MVSAVTSRPEGLPVTAIEFTKALAHQSLLATPRLDWHLNGATSLPMLQVTRREYPIG